MSDRERKRKGQVWRRGKQLETANQIWDVERSLPPPVLPCPSVLLLQSTVSRVLFSLSFTGLVVFVTLSSKRTTNPVGRRMSPSLFIVSLIRFFSLFNERTIRSSSSSSSSSFAPSFPLNPRLYSCFFFCVLPLFGWTTKERQRRAESRMAQESLRVRILNVVLTHETLSDEIFRNSKIQTPSCFFRCNFRGRSPSRALFPLLPWPFLTFRFSYVSIFVIFFPKDTAYPARRRDQTLRSFARTNFAKRNRWVYRNVPRHHWKSFAPTSPFTMTAGNLRRTL